MVESKFQTSFIPKKPIESRPTARGGRRPAGLFRIISIFILLISLMTWGGLFLWKSYLNSKIESDKASLAKSQKEFELGTVTTLTRLNTRLDTSQNLIQNHVAMSKLFTELQAITLKSVRFNDFSLTAGSVDKGVALTMKGQAASYASVAKQADAFSHDRNFKSPIFSNLDLDSTGRITFSVTTGLDPKGFLYGQLVNQ